jgi:hypothetical protein
MDKRTAIESLYDLYRGYKEGEKNELSRLVNKLLQVNYLTRKKDDDKNDYNSYLAYQDVFIPLFTLIDFEFVIDKANEVVYIKNEQSYNRQGLKKFESIFIFIFRIFYERKRDTITKNDNVEITIGEFNNEIKRLGVNDNKRYSKDTLKPIFQLLRSYNLIDYKGDEFTEMQRIKIYPTILFVVNQTELKDLIETLESYGGKDEDAN